MSEHEFDAGNARVKQPPSEANVPDSSPARPAAGRRGNVSPGGEAALALSLLSNTSNPVVVVRSDGAIRYVNPAFEHVTGYSSSEVLGARTAQYLVDTVAAARLLGSFVVLTGIRPAMAQTLVRLGVDLSDVATPASLPAALKGASSREAEPHE